MNTTHRTRAERATRFVLVEDAGPDVVPSGRGGMGSRSGRCIRFDGRPDGTEELRAPIPFQAPHRVATGDVLEYDVFAMFDATAPLGDSWHDGGYAATGVAVRLRFDDGSGSEQLRDQHGVDVDAEAQGASRTVSVDQWTRKRIPLDAVAGRTVVAAELVFAAHGHDARGWIDGPRIVRRTAASDHVSDRVVTTRGTNSSREYSRGLTAPATALPNAFAFLVPMTDRRRTEQPYSYQGHNGPDGRPRLDGVTVSHIASPWMRDWGAIQLTWSSSLDQSPSFDHDDEIARPHDYRVSGDGFAVRLAPSRSGGIVTGSFESGVTLSVGHPTGAVRVTHIVDDTLLGTSEVRETLGRDAPAVHFAIRFDEPFEVGGDGLSFPGGTFTARIATSFVSPARARETLDREIGAATVDELAARAREVWEALLGRVTVAGASDDQLATLYSNLYRLYLYPNEAHELDAAGAPGFADFLGHSGTVVPGGLTVNNGFWDTYRTAWPAYALLAPGRAKELLDGFVAHADRTGWVPRWSAPGASDSMVGTSSDIVFADSVIRGVGVSDLRTVYDTMLRNATTPSADPANGRKGIDSGRFRGFVANDIDEGLSWTLEGAINDFGIARFSEHLLALWGDEHPRAGELRANARYFGSRAQNYRLLFDARTGFFRGRDATGAFTGGAAFDPAEWGGDYTETNAWGMAFTAPHDPRLAELYGGKAGLERKLDAFFATPERADRPGWYPETIHEMVEARDIRMGMFGLSNQPAHHIPFMYAFTDAPHKTQSITRQAARRLFLGSDNGQGYPGDEDNGEMSMWHFFASLGLYPLRVGVPEFVLTAPLHDRISIEVDGGTLVVEAKDNAPGNDYIQSVRIDGAEWTSLRVPHRLVASGCAIEITLGPEPSAFGRGSFDAPDPWDDRLLRDLGPAWDAPRAKVRSSREPLVALSDDAGVADVSTRRGDWFEWSSNGRRPVLYTVTCGADPAGAPRAWSVFGRNADREELLDRRSAETFRWASQTRAFELPASAGFERYVFVWEADGELRQLELLAEEARAAEAS
ncbi:GH92 family glycosyl hydrolase [Galbitalea sp. SE-J8]|uniref:GH92 family glycosyl hydrolase n=1 Tax=Galbitalea sp. SE-J8 TaxID=3054952 RepID=UPI00259CA8D0|nr:GH92 family glycosyl hydrolase [Galbitalea sp. SE-J8]MDM4762206.1 GH92 family glycosyl hydrolase [Galbitalea sp. SE-J8]